MKQKGFTLIELLVVIAVIGILASVVLASLNSARKKGADAKIKSELKQISTALELYYDRYGTYRVNGSGYLDNGQGWVRFGGISSYPKAITIKLEEEGFLGSGLTTGTVDYGNYMLYVCNNDQQYGLAATLASASAEEIAHMQVICNGPDMAINYGKNYGLGN